MQEMQMGEDQQLPGNRRPTCAATTNMAEQELRRFLSDVTGLIGAEPARFLTQLWLEELALMDNSAGLTNCEWPLVTVAAVARLVRRLSMIRTPPLV
jgi:hypothetical protein